jgi:hypothetical protein
MPIQPAPSIWYGNQGPSPPVMSAETSSVRAPIRKPNSAPKLKPTKMMSRKIGDAPSTVGISRKVASSATSTPSSAISFEAPCPASAGRPWSVTSTSSKQASPSPVKSNGSSMPPRAGRVPTSASAGKKKGYRKPAAPIRLTSSRSIVPGARARQALAIVGYRNITAA